MPEAISPPPSPRPQRSGALNWVIIGLVLIGGLIYLAVSRKNAASAPAAIAANAGAPVLEAGDVAGRTAPAWTLQDVNGNPVSLSQFAGHPVVLDFWATWCGPCAIERPWWEEIQKTYAAQGLIVIGISEDQSLSDLKQFEAKTPLAYRVVWDNGQLQPTYGTPFGIPTTLFVNRAGKITERVVGLEGKPDLDKAVHGIL